MNILTQKKVHAPYKSGISTHIHVYDACSVLITVGRSEKDLFAFWTTERVFAGCLHMINFYMSGELLVHLEHPDSNTGTFLRAFSEFYRKRHLRFIFVDGEAKNLS